MGDGTVPVPDVCAPCGCKNILWDCHNKIFFANRPEFGYADAVGCGRRDCIFRLNKRSTPMFPGAKTLSLTDMHEMVRKLVNHLDKCTLEFKFWSLHPEREPVEHL